MSADLPTKHQKSRQQEKLRVLSFCRKLSSAFNIVKRKLSALLQISQQTHRFAPEAGELSAQAQRPGRFTLEKYYL